VTRDRRSSRPYDEPVSVRVDLDSLPAAIARSGASAFIVTVSSDGRPHVASVLVTVKGQQLAMRVGRTTRLNATERPAVTLVWATGREDGYCLIVDGEAQEGPMDNFCVRPASAVMHRLATTDLGEGAGR
jgi:hypothetical protein